MKITFSCPSCQKVYSVSAELAGKKAKCKHCQTLMYVPEVLAEPPIEPEPVPTVVEPIEPNVVHDVVNQPVPVSVQPVVGVLPPVDVVQPVEPVAQVVPVPVEPVVPVVPAVVPTSNAPSVQTVAPIVSDSLNSPGPPKLPNPMASSVVSGGSTQSDFQEEFVPDPRHVMDGTYASNPGEVKVSMWKYASSYPFWFCIWHGGLLMGLIMVPFFIVAGVLSILLFGFFCWFYWKRIQGQFEHGCANPAQVLSLDPPLIAALTDLTKGGYPTPVIKVLKQPLGKHAGPPLKVGQIIPTVAFYEDRFDQGPHWSTFDPKLVGCVTNDMNVVERVLGTFDADDLAELKQGVSQLPNPPVEGHFRIYQQEDFQRPFNLSIPEIQNLVFQYMQERSYVKVGNEIPPEMRSNSAAYVPVEALTGTWAIVELMKGAADGKNGVSFTALGIYYQFPGGVRGQIAYQDIVGALSSNSGVEVMLRSGERVYFDDVYFLRHTVQQFDLLLNEISGLNR